MNNLETSPAGCAVLDFVAVHSKHGKCATVGVSALARIRHRIAEVLKALILALLTVMCALVCPASAIAETSGRGEQASHSSSGSRTARSALDGYELTDQNGVHQTLSNLIGHTVVLNFVFTQCVSVCPTQTRQLVEVYKSIPEPIVRDVRFVTISVDPQHDSPAQLKTFAAALGADHDNWLFLTGSKQDIEQLTTNLRIFKPGQSNPAPAEHGTPIFLFDRNGRLMQRYGGAPVDVERLAREVPLLDQLVAKQ